MAEAFITIRTEITVDIPLARFGKLVDTAGIFRPVQIEILPKRRRALFQHRTVIRFHHGNRLRFIERGNRFQNIIAHKGRHALCTADDKHFFLVFR